jgi:hypothetical protein
VHELLSSFPELFLKLYLWLPLVTTGRWQYFLLAGLTKGCGPVTRYDNLACVFAMKDRPYKPNDVRQYEDGSMSCVVDPPIGDFREALFDWMGHAGISRIEEAMP